MRRAILVGATLLCGMGPAPAAPDDVPARPADAPRVERNEKVRRAVERGLAYLASTQNPDGSWTAKIGYKLNSDYRVDRIGSDVGVSGLAGMAFVANGHLPGRGRYGPVVERAVDYLLSRVDESGYVSDNGSRMYSHAFAGLFLAEVYGMTHRADLKPKLSRVVHLLVEAQKFNRHGGWRYDPVSQDADLSLTVCQLQLLRAAQNAGVAVPKETIQTALRYVQRCKSSLPNNEDSTVFLYQDGQQSRYSFALTAAGIVSLNSAGVYSGPDLRQAVESLFRMADEQQYGSFSYFYGHYYAVQAFYQQGTYWERYYGPLRDKILRHQRDDGAWHDVVDDNYASAMATLILSIPNGYLPIFQR
ncbi:MAG: terpene cyclase/mutase family protein [Planctomycetales bacterium]|nr:terpene cyclase/mutase family protein [Planctomycetales bacterium]